MRVACLSEISEAAPHNSASRFDERFFVKARFEKRRNTVCTRKGHAASVRLLRRQRLRNISIFSNRRIGGKDPSKREDAIVRCCPKMIPLEFQVKLANRRHADGKMEGTQWAS